MLYTSPKFPFVCTIVEDSVMLLTHLVILCLQSKSRSGWDGICFIYIDICVSAKRRWDLIITYVLLVLLIYRAL